MSVKSTCLQYRTIKSIINREANTMMELSGFHLCNILGILCYVTLSNQGVPRDTPF
jgi:hypothetical protein